MIWTTKRMKAGGRAPEGEVTTPRAERGEQRRSGGRRWKRRCSGKGYKGNSRGVHYNGVDSISPGVVHRTLHTLTARISRCFLRLKTSTCDMNENGKCGAVGVGRNIYFLPPFCWALMTLLTLSASSFKNARRILVFTQSPHLEPP